VCGADNKGVSVIVNDTAQETILYHVVRVSNPYHNVENIKLLQNREKETEQRLIKSPLHISLKKLNSIRSKNVK